VDEKGALKFGAAQMVAKYEVLPKAARLQKAAREAGVSVIHVPAIFREGYSDRPQNAALWQACVDAKSLLEGTWGAEIHPAVAPAIGDVVVVNKGTSAFTGSDLSYVLQAHRVDTLLLAGVATNFVIESTARAASDRGYEVIVVADCCTSNSPELHEAALNTVLPLLATIANSDEVIAALSQP
jgi:nicotinamidase-related amidase